MTDTTLSGQVALVTGGAGLIGAAISRRLASHGATVLINGRDAAKAQALADELTGQGATASIYVADIKEESQVEPMIAAAIERYGRLDILVNNAGGGFSSLVKDMSYDGWRHVLDLNLTGTFLCTKHALPHMQQQGYGRVVAISSAGYYGVIGQAGYAAAKAGIHAFIKTVALEHAGDGVTANVVAPHLVDSPRWQTRPQELKDLLLTPVPIKRFGTPEEIAGAVAFFCGPDSGYITGEILHVMGGMEWMGPGIDVSKGLQVPPRTS
jgi:3-oxoacyl-[acyl-carrier protein] reductase